MPRVNRVQKARKEQGSCRKCGKEIKKGDSYKFLKFRIRPRGSLTKKFCATCPIRASDRTTSDKLSQLYGAQEEAEDQAAKWKAADGIEAASTILEELATGVREVGEEYQTSADNIRESFSESPTADECEEKANELEGWADTLENGLDGDVDDFEFDDSELKDDATKDEKNEAEETQREAWGEDVQSSLSDKIGECPI